MKVRAGLVHTERENERASRWPVSRSLVGGAVRPGGPTPGGTDSVRRCLAAPRGRFGVGEQRRSPSIRRPGRRSCQPAAGAFFVRGPPHWLGGVHVVGLADF